MSTRSVASRFVGRLRKHPVGALSAVILLLVIVCAVLAEVVAPHAPSTQNYTAILSPPSAKNWFGTDEFGRDILSRLIFGARVSILVGISSVAAAILAGSGLGLVAGYVGGSFDEVTMRLMDALYAFPAIILALAITVVLGPGVPNVIAALAIVYTPVFARLTRASVLSVKARDYVSAAIALGGRPLRIIVQHVAPNVLAPIVVQASLSVSFAIITEASLSFLGVGVQPPTPSWGAMLRSGYGYLELAPWYALFPGLVIFVTVLALNLVGDTLRDLLDPRLNRS